MRPPRNGTLSKSRRCRDFAIAREVIKGTCLRGLIGPAQWAMTNVRKDGAAKSLNGCCNVRRTNRRYKCFSVCIRGSSGMTTPVRWRDVIRGLERSDNLLLEKMGKKHSRFLKVPSISSLGRYLRIASSKKISEISMPFSLGAEVRAWITPGMLRILTPLCRRWPM